MASTDAQQIRQFVADLEAALNAHDATAYNRRFSTDVSWGNPDGGRVEGLMELHAVHQQFLDGPLRHSRFTYGIERIELVAADAAFAHCRLTRTATDGIVESDERCLYVLARRDGDWQLRAGHNTRIQVR